MEEELKILRIYSIPMLLKKKNNENVCSEENLRT